MSGPEFRRELEREKRRAERSLRALSLTVLRVPSEDDAGGLVAELLAVKRETDLVGWLDAATLAVLCVDTNAQGREGFLRKVTKLTAGRGVAMDAATFPEALFERLARGCAADVDAQAERLIAGEAESAGYAGKRIFDCLFAALALLVLAPLLLLVALAIALDSPGPAIYPADAARTGWSAVHLLQVPLDAERRGRPHPPRLRGRPDPRWRRAACATGLPTPTSSGGPARHARRALHSQDQHRRAAAVVQRAARRHEPGRAAAADARTRRRSTRPGICAACSASSPGITGLWQVDGRSRVRFDEMVRMDLRYIRECSLALDLRILLKTVVVVVRGDGAD